MRNIFLAAFLMLSFFLVAGTDASASEQEMNSLGKAISLIPLDSDGAEALLSKRSNPIAIGWRMYIIASSSPENSAKYEKLAQEYKTYFKKEIPIEGADVNVENALEYVMYAYLQNKDDKGTACIPAWLFKKHPKAAMEASWAGSYGGFNSLFIRDSYCPQTEDTPCSIPEYLALRKLLYEMDGAHASPCRGSIEYAVGTARWKWEYMLGVDIALLELFRECKALSRLEEFIDLWANKGVWEKAKVRAYHTQRATTVAALEKWFEEHKFFSSEKAAKYAAMIADELASRVVGRFPKELLNETKAPWYLFATARDHASASLDRLKAVLPKKQLTLNYMLHVCVLNHQPVEIIKALHSAGATLKDDAENETILAVDDAHYLEQILTLGVPVDHVNRFGKSALSYAVQLGYLDSVKVLLAHGADINRATTPLEGSYDDGWEKNNPFWYPGCYAVDGGKTPLMYACEQASLSMVKFLLQHGAQSSGQNSGVWKQLLEQNEIMTSAEKDEARTLFSLQ